MTTQTPASVLQSVEQAAAATITGLDLMTSRLTAMSQSVPEAVARLQGAAAQLVATVQAAQHDAVATLQAALATLQGFAAGLTPLPVAPAQALEPAALPVEPTVTARAACPPVEAPSETTTDSEPSVEPSAPATTQTATAPAPSCVHCGKPRVRRGKGYRRACVSCGREHPST
jgi:hypothetical protein